MVNRVLQCLVAALLAIDMAIQVGIFSIPYCLNPSWGMNARWSISGRVGAMAAKGWFFGLVMQNLIDEIPCFGKGHCARAARTDNSLSELGA